MARLDFRVAEGDAQVIRVDLRCHVEADPLAHLRALEADIAHEITREHDPLARDRREVDLADQVDELVVRRQCQQWLGRVGRNVVVGVALLRELGSREIVDGRSGRVDLPDHVRVPVVAQAHLGADAVGGAGLRGAQLPAQQPLVGGGQFHFLHRHGSKGDKATRANAQLRRPLRCHTVEAQVGGPQQVGAEPRVAEATGHHIDHVGVAVADVGAVEGRRVAVAIDAQRLVRRSRIARAAGGQAHARRPVVVDDGGQSQAGPHAQPMAVFGGVQQTDRAVAIGVRHADRGRVVGREPVELVAGAKIAVDGDGARPRGHRARRRPALAGRLRRQFGAQLVLDLLAHELRNIRHADRAGICARLRGAGRGRPGCRGRCRCRHFFQQRFSLVARQHALLDQQADQLGRGSAHLVDVGLLRSRWKGQQCQREGCRQAQGCGIHGVSHRGVGGRAHERLLRRSCIGRIDFGGTSFSGFISSRVD